MSPKRPTKVAKTGKPQCLEATSAVGPSPPHPLERIPNFSKIRAGLRAMQEKAGSEQNRLWAHRTLFDVLRRELSTHKCASGKGKTDPISWESDLTKVAMIAGRVAEGASLCEADQAVAASHQPNFDLLVKYLLDPNQKSSGKRGKAKPEPGEVRSKPRKASSKRKIVFGFLEKFPRFAREWITPMELLTELLKQKLWKTPERKHTVTKIGVHKPEGRDPELCDLDSVKQALFTFRKKKKASAENRKNG